MRIGNNNESNSSGFSYKFLIISLSKIQPHHVNENIEDPIVFHLLHELIN